MNKPIWEGIFQDISEVNAVGKAFDSERWVENSRLKVQRSFSSFKKGKNIIPPIPIRPTSLPLVTAMTGQKQEGEKIIVDFGGGLGFSYLSFIQSCMKAKDYKYFIIESTEVCKTGEEIFSDYQNLFFITDLHKLPVDKVDIVYMNSVLQYIADWEALIENLLGLNPEYVLLDDLPAGDIPTFATCQNYYESKIPYWFFNISDILFFLELYGFALQYKSKFFSTILGTIQKIPMSNFPVQYQLEYPCTLLFTKQIRNCSGE